VPSGEEALDILKSEDVDLLLTDRRLAGMDGVELVRQVKAEHPDLAVVVMTAGSPLYGLERAGGYFAGETVAVLGPGPIGLMALQLVKALGAVRVILTGTRPARLVLGKELGADVVVNSREQDPVAAVREATGGRGADVTLDCAGGDDTFDQSIRMAKSGGKVLLGDALMTDWRSRTTRGTARVRGYYDVHPHKDSRLTLDAASKNRCSNSTKRARSAGWARHARTISSHASSVGPDQTDHSRSMEAAGVRSSAGSLWMASRYSPMRRVQRCSTAASTRSSLVG